MGKGLFGGILRGWSLELKSLILIGGTLLISLFVAFFFVQYLARRLVMETTRQAARDFATSVVGWEHLGNIGMEKPSSALAIDVLPSEDRRELLSALRSELLASPFSYDFMRLETDGEFDDLGGKPPSTPRERELLERLQASYRERLSLAEKPQSEEGEANVENRDKLAYEITSPGRGGAIFREVGPVDGFYFYYHPIPFRQGCIICHSRKFQEGTVPTDENRPFAERSPFRVVRVKMPYENTRVWTIWTLSILITVGLTVLAVTSFIVHRILKRLVIKPLSHLREVSDAISEGNMDRRAAIDTEDEFHALAQAFNGMLRRIIDTQTELQTLNRQLDDRVDQLAQANLQLFEANKLKGDFLANMTHELRTPLNSILGFSEVLESNDQLSEKQRRFAANIRESGRQLLSLVDDVLNLAKIEAGKLEVHATHFELRPVVHSQCELQRKLADDKNIEIQIDEGQGSTMVYQDQTKIQQILTNLISNAIKFTPEGGLITIRFEVVQDRILLAVSDTGVGIPEDEFEVIFEKFRQSSATSNNVGMTREYTGTGLGLSIVRELCKLLGGDIHLCSELGKGSTFRVILPSHFGEPLNSATTRTTSIEPIDPE